MDFFFGGGENMAMIVIFISKKKLIETAKPTMIETALRLDIRSFMYNS